jgi:hypothetical protein
MSSTTSFSRSHGAGRIDSLRLLAQIQRDNGPPGASTGGGVSAGGVIGDRWEIGSHDMIRQRDMLDRICITAVAHRSACERRSRST